MDAKPDRKTLTGREAFQKTLRIFSDLQHELLLSDHAEVTITQSVRDGLVKTLFNISDVKIAVTIKQSEL